VLKNIGSNPGSNPVRPPHIKYKKQGIKPEPYTLHIVDLRGVIREEFVDPGFRFNPGFLG
jgi:hypothetical protein